MSHRFFDRPFEDRHWPRGLGGRHGLGGRRGWTGVRLLLALLWALALVPLASSTVHAQPQLDSVRDILERTDRVLERAREQVSASVSSRPGMLLGQAIELQRRAWESFRAGSPNSRKAALSLTQQALDLARKAIESADIEAKAHESIRELIESTRDLIDEATPAVRERGDPEATRLLESGVWQLGRAQDAYRSGEYRMAIRLAAIARDLVQRSLQRSTDRAAAGADPGIALERTDALLEEVALALRERSDNKAAALYGQARDLQEKARQMAREGRRPQAVRLSARARDLGLQALFLLARDPAPDEVERALVVVEELIDDVSPEIRASGSREAVTLLDSARERRSEAAEQLAAGKTSQAIESARIAEALLRRAVEAAGIR